MALISSLQETKIVPQKKKKDSMSLNCVLNG